MVKIYLPLQWPNKIILATSTGVFFQIQTGCIFLLPKWIWPVESFCCVRMEQLVNCFITMETLAADHQLRKSIQWYLGLSWSTGKCMPNACTSLMAVEKIIPAQILWFSNLMWVSWIKITYLSFIVDHRMQHYLRGSFLYQLFYSEVLSM